MSKRRKVLLAVFFMLWIQSLMSIGITEVDGISMNNTLKDGSYYPYINKKYTTVDRFDIVIVDSKALDDLIVKRVVGLPGENVKMVDGILYIDGEEVKQDFDYVFQDDNFEISLEDEEYFVLGDNRPVSLDSRRIGVIEDSEIEGVLP